LNKARNLLVPALVVFGGLVWVETLVLMGTSRANDALAYYLADPAHPYGTSVVGGDVAYLYSPAFAQAVEPLRWLGADGFSVVWRAIEAISLVAVTGPLSGPLGFLPPFREEIRTGNVHVLIGLAMLLGFRWPAAWAFVLLTKVTPGVGLLWFAVRGEWRKLGIALGATAAIAAVSFVLAPSAWFEWAQLLASQAGAANPNWWTITQVPLLVRFPVAALIAIWAGRTDRKWALFVAGFLALPVMWWMALGVLTPIAYLILRERRERSRLGEPSPQPA
jgi:hypothetical protein